MILETLDALIRAGTDALQTTCGLTVTHTHVSLVGNGSLTFPALGELRIRNGSLQKVHLGCDTALVGRLPGRIRSQGGRPGLEVLAGRVLSSLLEEMAGRRPRGAVENLAVAPLTLHTRGQRTFGVRLETEAGRLFLLAEVPSNLELESTRNGDFVAGMIAKYLPAEWRQRTQLQAGMAIDSFLVLLRKLEVDVYLEAPGSEGLAGPRSGIVLGHGAHGGQRALRLCADLAGPDLAPPAPGLVLRASVGLEDRSFGFDLEFLAGDELVLAGGAHLPAGWFVLPEAITISQRRRSFRMPLTEPLKVELETVEGLCLASPWGDGEPTTKRLSGTLSDLSFEGARVVLPTGTDNALFEAGGRTRCHLALPGEPLPLAVSAVIRRLSLSLADRNEWQRDIGLEFVVACDEDRAAIDRIREFVLALQRSRLANRVSVAGSRQG